MAALEIALAFFAGKSFNLKLALAAASLIMPKVLTKDLVKGKDVDMPIKNKEPTLKEKDGKVQTRLGNVKVKRVGGNGL